MEIQIVADVRGFGTLRGVEMEIKATAIRQAEELEHARQMIKDEIRRVAAHHAEEAEGSHQRTRDENQRAAL